jgi:hypothetical protein
VYVGNRSPTWVIEQLIELPPRGGLLEFVDRHLDVFRWINREDCVFAGRPKLFMDSDTPGSASVEGASTMEADGAIFAFEELD